jgi:hypothetical protein
MMKLILMFLFKLSDEDPRSRSGSGGSQPDQIQKSNSDSVVTGANVVLSSNSLLERREPLASTCFIVPPSHPATTPASAVLAPNKFVR